MKRSNGLILGGLLVALLLAALVSGFASSSPDGLNRVAEDKGFSSTETDHATGGGPLAGYGVSGISNDRLGTGAAGVVGVVLTFAVGGALFYAVRRRGGSSSAEASDGRGSRVR